MTRDLEETLKELGPGYREIVERLKSEPEILPALPSRRPVPWALAAASVAVVLGIAAVFVSRPSHEKSAVYAVRATTSENEYFLAELRNDDAVREMIRTQRADGGWKNDFLTRKNAEVLRTSGVDGARIAYKKAMRNLRLRGVPSL